MKIPMVKRSLAALVASALAVSCAHKNPAARYQAAPSAMERQVQNAIDAGDGDLVARSLRERMMAAPDNLAVRMELARHYQERGYREIALEHFRLAASRFPDSGEAHLMLARALRDAGIKGEAAAGLAQFLKAHPQQSPEFAAWLGILQDDLGRWPEGEAAHRAALELAPNADYLHNNLGYNLLMQGRREEAAAQFRAALKLQPKSALARNNLALALASTPEGGTQREAITQWQSVSDPASAHSNMAALLIEQGRYPEARRELDLALGYNRNHPAALNNLRLISQLDGKPAFIPMKPVQSRWARWKSTLRKAVGGPQQQDQTQQAKENQAVHTATK